MMRAAPPVALRRLASLVESCLGQMPKEALDQGWRRLERHLAPGEQSTPAIFPRSLQMSARIVGIREPR
jgi:hypothetical protein